jgi:hypothetical protein
VEGSYINRDEPLNPSKDVEYLSFELDRWIPYMFHKNQNIIDMAKILMFFKYMSLSLND